MNKESIMRIAKQFNAEEKAFICGFDEGVGTSVVISGSIQRGVIALSSMVSRMAEVSGNSFDDTIAAIVECNEIVKKVKCGKFKPCNLEKTEYQIAKEKIEALEQQNEQLQYDLKKESIKNNEIINNLIKSRDKKQEEKELLQVENDALKREVIRLQKLLEGRSQSDEGRV